MSDARQRAARAAWDRVRHVAQARGISTQEARTMIAQGVPCPELADMPLRLAAIEPVIEPVKTTKPIETLEEAEARLLAKYPHAVKGTLRPASPGSNKPHIEIACQHPGCRVRRTVATSDLFQVRYCVEHTLARRAERKAEAKQA
jgi:hypothetical protein